MNTVITFSLANQFLKKYFIIRVIIIGMKKVKLD